MKVVQLHIPRPHPEDKADIEDIVLPNQLLSICCFCVPLMHLHLSYNPQSVITTVRYSTHEKVNMN